MNHHKFFTINVFYRQRSMDVNKNSIFIYILRHATACPAKLSILGELFQTSSELYITIIVNYLIYTNEILRSRMNVGH